jgi:UTP--glucose-1-phosphate uridylyltransferase
LARDSLAECFSNSGLLDKLIAAGKEYIFISNVDNLGAVVDLNIMQTMIDSQAEYVMEVTDKTKADIKGGTIIDYEGKARLLEVAQVPKDHLDEFCSTRKFKICKWLSLKAKAPAMFPLSVPVNTNNIWCNLRAIKRVMDEDALSLEIIVNNKVGCLLAAASGCV